MKPTALNAILEKKVKQELIKYGILGLLLSLSIGVGTYMLWVQETRLYEGNPEKESPNTSPEQGIIPLKTRLAQDIMQAIPTVIHVDILGNATGLIYPNLLEAFMNRLGDENNYRWNTSATLLTTNMTIEEKTFTITNKEVNDIAQAMFSAINQSTIKGKYGEAPYNQDLPSFNWGIKLYLENSTAISIITWDHFVLLSTEHYTTYQNGVTLTGAYVLEPASTFQVLLNTLSQTFHTHLD